MNRAEMRTEVRRILGETTADFWSDDELNSWLNEALRRFSQEEKWPWLVTEVTNGLLSAGVDTFDLVEGISFPRHINFLLTPAGSTRSYQPQRVSASEGFRLLTIFGSTTGDPLYFYPTRVTDTDSDALHVVTVRFVPMPNRNMTVAYQYYRTPPDMTADTDVPDMPIQYHMLLVHDAAGKAFLKELNWQHKAAEQFELRNAILEQARAEYLSEAPDDFIVVGGEAPQLGAVDDDLYTRLRIPDTLGP